MELRIGRNGVRLTALLAALALAGCATAAGPTDQIAGEAAPSIPAALPPGIVAIPMSPLGAYLSGRVAQEEHDLPAALAFYQAALGQDPGNVELATRVFVLAVAEGRFDIAGPQAAKLIAADPDMALGDLVQMVEDMKAGHADAALERLQHLPQDSFYRFLGSLSGAWVKAAQKGHTADALAELDALDRNTAVAGLKSLHTALIDDLAGDNEAAADNYRAALAGDRQPLRFVELAGNFFERNGQRDEAAKLYADFAASSAAGEAGFAPALTEGGPPPRLIKDARRGLAEALFDVASVLNEASSPEVALLDIRLVLELEPNFPLARLVLGDVLETEHRLQPALEIYRSIDPKSPFAWTARLRAASVMDALGQHDAAEAALQQMATERPDQVQPLIELGDIKRGHDQFLEAASSYGDALTRLGDGSSPRYWSLYYSRGIANERGGRWPAAEADLRQALKLRPDQPDVLNYLGYSLVERREHLPEAIKLIRQAVDLRPNDGYVVDSLGWAYFQTGNFTDAQTTLEHAVELKPGDAEITDHLGDAYWQGGKREEARQQWHRALDLNPEPDLAKAIEAKLERPPAPKHASAPAHPGG